MSTRPYNVLLVDLAHAFGGAEVRVLTQARALQERVRVCRVAVMKDSPLHVRCEAEGLPCEILDLGRSNPALILALQDLITRRNYSVVDAHNVQSILWAHWAAALAGAPGRVATIHSDFGREYPGPKGWFYDGVLRLGRMVARQYITVTEVLQEQAIARGDAQRSTLIYNAVPVPPEPLQQVVHDQRATWECTDDDFVLAIIARLKPVKGHRYLFEAMASLSDLPRVKLLVVGEGPLLPELETQVAALGLQERVYFAGFQQDIPAILRNVDALCLPSLSEALPYVVLEAASYARPMLVSQVGGLATLLTDRQDALLVPPQDSQALANGIRWLVDNPEPARQLGLEAYDLVKRKFSVDTMIEQVLAVYDRALR